MDPCKLCSNCGGSGVVCIDQFKEEVPSFWIGDFYYSKDEEIRIIQGKPYDCVCCNGRGSYSVFGIYYDKKYKNTG